jgi:hypothetical protein
MTRTIGTGSAGARLVAPVPVPEDYTPDPVPIASELVRLRRRPDQCSKELPVRFASKNELIAGARRASRGNGDKECQRAAGNATHFGGGAGLTIVQFHLGHLVRRNCKDAADHHSLKCLDYSITWRLVDARRITKREKSSAFS